MSTLADRPSNNIRNSIFAKSYLIGLVASLLLWPLLGPALAAEIGIVLFWGVQLIFLIFERISDQAWVRLVVEFFPPLVLWVLFGLGGILALLRLDGWDMYSTYDDLTVLLTTIFMLIGSYAYLLGIRLALGHQTLVLTEKQQDGTGKARLLLLVVLLIDWSVRMHKTLVGIYVLWIASSGFFSNIERGTTNALYHLQSHIGMVSIPLLVYLSLKDRRKWLFRFLLLIQFVFIFAVGNREQLLIALATGACSFALVRGVHLQRRVVVWSLLVTLIFFGMLSPIIQKARIQMRNDARILVTQQTSIPISFLTVYVRDAANLETLFDDSLQGNLVTRLGGYNYFAVSIHQSLLEGKARLRSDELLPALKKLIPRVLYPNKGMLPGNDEVLSHYKIGIVGRDTHGTPVADIFGYAYVFGIVALMFVTGLGYGLIAKYLTNVFGLLGGLVTIGMIPLLVPEGDSFVAYLIGLRNSLILLLLLALISLVYSVGTSHGTSRSSSIEEKNVPT